MHRELIILCNVVLCAKFSSQINRISIIHKLFNRQPEENVSKFPPVIEFFVQKIQSQYSNYVYEDLSRPPVWNKPVYTLSPEDQVLFSSLYTTPNTTILNEADLEYIDTDNTTEIFFEIIIDKNKEKNNSTHNGGSNVVNLDKTTERLFETIKTTEYPGNKTFVYITPKKPFTTTSKYEKSNLKENDEKPPL